MQFEKRKEYLQKKEKKDRGIYLVLMQSNVDVLVQKEKSKFREWNAMQASKEWNAVHAGPKKSEGKGRCWLLPHIKGTFRSENFWFFLYCSTFVCIW